MIRGLYFSRNLSVLRRNWIRSTIPDIFQKLRKNLSIFQKSRRKLYVYGLTSKIKKDVQNWLFSAFGSTFFPSQFLRSQEIYLKSNCTRTNRCVIPRMRECQKNLFMLHCLFSKETELNCFIWVATKNILVIRQYSIKKLVNFCFAS